MKTNNKKQRALHFGLALAMASLLAGCSSLQVDVDVYKGALANEREIQIRQYVSLAAATKVRIQNLQCQAFEDMKPKDIQWTLKNDRWKLADLKENAPFSPIEKAKLKEKILRLESQLYAQEFLSDVLALYLDWPADKSQKTSAELDKYKGPCTNDDISTLATEATMKALERRSVRVAAQGVVLLPPSTRLPTDNSTPPDKQDEKIIKGLDSLSQKVRKALASGDTKKKKINAINEAVGQLNDEMIFFAQKLLNTANNDLLYKSLGVSYNDKMKDGISALQSIGNTIIVQSNDLQRQLTRQQLLDDHAASERTAIGNAFHLAPSLAFDHIVQAVAQSIADDPNQAIANSTASDLSKLRETLVTQQNGITNYLPENAAVLAAYRTLVGELPKSLTVGKTINAIERKAAQKDRGTISTLFPNIALRNEDKTANGAITPLLDWLNAEQAASAALEPQRAARLKEAASYFNKEKERLSKTASTLATRDKILVHINSTLIGAIDIAKKQVAFNTEQLKTIPSQIKRLDKEIDKRNATSNSTATAPAPEQTTEQKRDAITKLLLTQRDTILQQADSNQLSGVTAIQTLLKLKLAALKTVSTNGALAQANIIQAYSLVSDLPQIEISACDSEGAQDKDSADAPPKIKGNEKKKNNASCKESAIDVLDNQIAALRAQRVHAIATGNPDAANNYLAAINVAYEQRASLIFLRPAGDYLRSVYSANALQGNLQKTQRNMLLDWLGNILPDRDAISGITPSEIYHNGPNGKEELEKLHWQNVNRVTLSGGGKANYVLAKDDVGNWYVKSYSADPESIFKSATSLALFNSGKTISTNLLRRNDLQQQLDKSNDATERAQIKGELDKVNSSDGIGLTKVHDRYAKRYRDDTLAQASAVLGTLTSIKTKVDDVVNDPTSKLVSCDLNKLKQDLAALDENFIKPTREELKTLLTPSADNKTPTPADEAKNLIAIEEKLQKSLINLQLYAGQVRRTLADAKPANCETTSVPVAIADKAKKVVQDKVTSIATERKKIIERFEDTLDSLTQIAADN